MPSWLSGMIVKQICQPHEGLRDSFSDNHDNLFCRSIQQMLRCSDLDLEWSTGGVDRQTDIAVTNYINSTWKVPHYSNPETTVASSATKPSRAPPIGWPISSATTGLPQVYQYQRMLSSTCQYKKLSFERKECRKGAWDSSTLVYSQWTGVILDNKVFCWTVKYALHPQVTDDPTQRSLPKTCILQSIYQYQNVSLPDVGIGIGPIEYWLGSTTVYHNWGKL